MRTLQQRAGRALFDRFLRGWFDQNAFRSVTTDQFKHYLRDRPHIKGKSQMGSRFQLPG